MLNEKCFAIDKNGGCRALEVRHCPGYSRCAFYKARWVQERDLDRIDAKLQAMSEEKQRHIADKYHHGDMPWRKEQE